MDNVLNSLHQNIATEVCDTTYAVSGYSLRVAGTKMEYVLILLPL